MKKIVLIAIIIFIFIFMIIFIQNNYKTEIFGNNIDSKSCEDLQKYILNISAYNAVVDVTVNSNKTKNQYRLKQKYKDGEYYQEVIEPETIKGTSITYDGRKLKIENSNLNLNKIYENYKYIASNQLDLQDFLEDYKSSSDASLKEEENQIILETTVKNETRYLAKKILYVDKKTQKPTKLEIKDNTQNISVYILYKEIEINSLQGNDVLAFKLQTWKQI